MWDDSFKDVLYSVKNGLYHADNEGCDPVDICVVFIYMLFSLWDWLISICGIFIYNVFIVKLKNNYSKIKIYRSLKWSMQ